MRIIPGHLCVCAALRKKQLMDVFTVTSHESVKYTQVDDGQMTCWYSKKLQTDSRNCGTITDVVAMTPSYIWLDDA